MKPITNAASDTYHIYKRSKTRKGLITVLSFYIFEYFSAILPSQIESTILSIDSIYLEYCHLYPPAVCVFPCSTDNSVDGFFLTYSAASFSELNVFIISLLLSNISIFFDLDATDLPIGSLIDLVSTSLCIPRVSSL
jgi:hypothetical protein